MGRETLSARLRDKRGTVTIIVVLVMLVLIGFAAFAIDVGYMMVRRNEFQNIADTAAIAATGQLGSIYATMPYLDALAYEPASEPLLAKAQEVAGATGISGITISDFRLGNWIPATRTFIPASTGPTAVQVTVRTDGVANGSFTTLLAGVVGIGSFDVSTTATASLTSLYAAPKGGLPLPVGISLAWFGDPEVYCVQPIKLYPTNCPEGCAGWNVYEELPASANQLSTILQGLNNGTYTSPETTAGITAYNFTGGTLTSVFDDMKALFDTMRVKNDGVIDKDIDPNTWTTAVPVYDWPDCSNPNPRDGAIKIVGFSTIIIKSVLTTPEKTINAQVVCDSIVNGPGGGGLTLGTMGSIPNLVQ